MQNISHTTVHTGAFGMTYPALSSHLSNNIFIECNKVPFSNELAQENLSLKQTCTQLY